MTIAPPQPSAAATAGAARARVPRATPTWWRASTRDALIVSQILVTALWAYPHGLADLSGGAAAALTSFGRLTGLIASDLLLVQVLLMAPVPVIERAWGRTSSPACTGSSASARSTSCWPISR